MAIVFSSKINGDVTDMYTANNYYTGMSLSQLTPIPYASHHQEMDLGTPTLTFLCRLFAVLGRNGRWPL